MSLTETLSIFTLALNPNCSNEQFTAFKNRISVKNDQQAEAKLNIYRHSISHSHVDTLISIFPVCAAIVGERLFAQWGRNYFWGSTSCHQDLNNYGDSFPEFITQLIGSSTNLNEFGYLPDLAQLEYAWNQALFCADDPSFDFEQFKQHSSATENMQFQVSSSVFLMQSNYPIFEIFESHRNSRLCSSIAAIKEPEIICISRPELTPLAALISRQQYALLKACRQGLTLGEIESDPDLSMALLLLPKLIEEKKITGFSVKGHTLNDNHVQ